MTLHRERFANRLRMLRQERGYAAARHFAQALGIPENRYSRYERGDSEPDLSDIYNFLAKLPASADELFGTGEPHRGPGFASGPQEPMRETPAEDDGDKPPDRVVADDADVDAAAWKLAATVVMHKRQLYSARPVTDRLSLTELRETSRLFKALQKEPFETVAALVADSAMESLPRSSLGPIEEAIAAYLARFE